MSFEINNYLDEIRDFVTKQISQNASTQSKLIEVYLKEYLSVNNIKESELRDNLTVVFNKEDSSVTIHGKDSKIIFGVKWHFLLNDSPIVEVFGEYIASKGAYPLTDTYLKTIKNESSKSLPD